MDVAPELRREQPRGTARLGLWAGFLGPPVIFLVALQLVYALVPWACRTGHRFVLPLSALGCLALCAGAGVLAWRDWRGAGRGWPRNWDPNPPARDRFLSVLGLMNAALFTLIHVGFFIAVLMIDPCWD